MRKFLYIDNQDRESVNTFAEGFNQYHIIDIEVLDMEDNRTFEDITKAIKEKWNSIDGVILDLRLNEGKYQVNFTATTLAQNIRSFCADECKYDKPIVLCSDDFENSDFGYSRDFASHDLFDFSFKKDFEIDSKQLSEVLKSLADGYRYINESQKEEDKEILISNLLKRDLRDFDSSVFEFITMSKSFNTVAFANFIIKEMFGHPGILINEDLLAARIGVDKTASEDWCKFKNEVFADCRYIGVFAEMKEMFWSNSVVSKLREFTKTTPSIVRANDRVVFVREATGFQNLIPAEKILFCKSDRFWTICEGNRRPIDPIDGFMKADDNDLMSWQEPRYYSFDFLLNKVAEADLKNYIRKTEVERFHIFGENIDEQ
jgi:hypothetical protein